MARPVDVAPVIRDFAGLNVRLQGVGRMRVTGILIAAALAMVTGLSPGASAAQLSDAVPSARVEAKTSDIKPTDVTAQRRARRQPTRLRVYRTTPGPNSKRVCNAKYVQEYRPSGTVIVPVVNCYWSG